MSADPGKVSGDVDNTVQGVQKWVRTQGYGLEHVTAAAFRAQKYRVRQGAVYRSDNDLGEIDVIAEPVLEGPYRFIAVVECKRSRSAWVIRKSQLAKEEFHWSPIASAGLLEHMNAYWGSLVQAPFPVDQPTAFDVVQAHRDPGAANPAYRALQQAVDSAAALLKGSAYPEPVLYLPTVVTDAPMYTLTFNTAGDEELQPTAFERVVLGSARSWSSLVAVDLVSVADLEDHVVRLRHSVQAIRAALPDTAPAPVPGPPFASWG